MGYGSYPQNSGLGELPTEYKKRLFTTWQIYRLTNNSVESYKVSSIELPFYNRIYESNPWNSDFDDFPFDWYERLIARRLIYRINDYMVLRMNNGLNVDV